LVSIDPASARHRSTRNGLPASGAIGTAPLLSPIETPFAPIVATPHTESAKQADQTSADAPVVAESFVERRPPPLETEAEPKPSMQLAALDPDARLLEESDQPASKGLSFPKMSSDDGAIDAISIADEVARSLIPRELR